MQVPEIQFINAAQQIEVKMKLPVWQPLKFENLQIQVYVKSFKYTEQYEASLFLANIIACKPQISDVFLCGWWLFALKWSDPREVNLCVHKQGIWAKFTCSFIEPCCRFLVVNVLCHSSVLYPGQMRALLLLAPCLFHFGANLSLGNSQDRLWLEGKWRKCHVHCHRLADWGWNPVRWIPAYYPVLPKFVDC